MIKINKKILITLIISILCICCISAKVEAAYSATNQTVKSGESVSITIKSTEKLENFDLACTDVGGLIYKSCSSSVTGAVVNSAGKKISYALIGGEATTLGTYNFTAPEVTEQKIYTVKFDVNGENVSATITVKPIETKPDTSEQETPTTPEKPTTPETPTTPSTPDAPQEKPKEKSTNAYLKTLGVRIKSDLAKELGVKTNEYDFSGFSKKKTSYNVTIPKNVDYLSVQYKTEDSNATVKVTGNSGFEVGSNNKITIKVTAEDGKTTQTYTIKVTKLAEEEEKPGNVIEEEKEELYLTSLKLEGIELVPEFAKDTYSYTATVTDFETTKLNVEAKASNEKAKIDISGNEEIKEGENTINIVLTLEKSTVQTVYQIVVTKDVDIIQTVIDSDEIPAGSNIMGALKNYAIIAIGVVLFLIVSLIVLIILLKRENKRLDKEDTEEEYTEEKKAEEYNVYENDENEFENKNKTADNFIESLYRQRNGSLYNEEELEESEKETLEEINRETDRIFSPKVQGQSVEYISEEEPREKRTRRREKGKHSK